MIYFLLPAYNEEVALPLVLKAISSLEFTDEKWLVVVVDDGSTDGTPEILRDWSDRIPLNVLIHSPNQGLGRAMRTGLEFLGGVLTDGDAVVALDSDNTHDPSLAVRMRREQKENELDIVIASRYFRGGGDDRGREIGLTYRRKILSRVASFLLGLVFHLRGARDYTCGFRLYSGRILRVGREVYGERLVEEPNFVCMAELLVKLARLGARIGEVPLTLRYDLKGGASKLRMPQTILRYLRLIWRYKVLGELRRFKLDSDRRER